MSSKQTVFVNEFTNGLLDPSAPMLGPVRDGGNIVANTAAGCWGPMITPALRGGHEVTKPVYVEGAEPGDAIAIRIRSIEVTSEATASGVEYNNVGRFDGDPFVADYCPKCGTKWPESYVEGTGNDAVRCKVCGAPVSAFGFDNGYTIAFDEAKKMGLTVGQEQATAIGSDAKTYMKTPDGSIQNPVVVMAPAHLPGVAARMKPFLGQLGTTPSQIFPDSHNAGDFGAFLLGAPHPYAKTETDLEARTDGHMDINRVRPGAILICPVKVPGGGVYIGEASDSGFLWPAPSCHRVSSPYGWRSSGWHNGIDLVKAGGGASGTPVIASKSGRVEVVQRSSSGYGNMVLINHGDGYKTRYAHMIKGSITVSVGDYVEAGRTIGKVGSTGNSTGPHLHFEVIRNGETQNPKNYIY